ncbi:hypothetical protein GGH91_004169 [Coemansia sp. RSA 2671]|uniref:SHSP domain-containing protein n=2 Tax=Coemansia TaxID=4863 RepID=A0A9W8GMB9_9FUNG|nr:hypothetical protein LPJ60_005814 [Coemansia sp. RSA 2675]KAJ2003798.1 hypothetical protein GGI06_005600 [Coemansia sp. S85]KAJ2012134.1 hypothetical protein IWW57_006408 [Coemansia sp. S610]KAJ2340436.1 hypothetical protein GGH91_004169 [Coemansia sp. RSA 2671]KAJ2358592.1 hypothetical protein H4S02_012332 [Coemansia sp. RSA 2611]KAJ2415310.1 hypothetical protein GGI10_001783 [Coemansia sp. RSA 2530]KAJ2687372.1 hypothetical protein IWW39_002963 [Coemansia spiralis]KAJ2695212.1 hypotheti
MQAPNNTGNDDALDKAGSDMGSLFSGFFGSIESLRQTPGAPPATSDVNDTIASISADLWAPRVERLEDDSSITLTAHLPNVPTSQIHISTDTPGRLKIYGECNNQVVYERGTDRVTERQLGQFEKDIPLPSSACIEQMTTAFHGPNVVIRIPKC